LIAACTICTVKAGYPTSTDWLIEVLNNNSRVGAYPSYVTTGIM